MPSETPASALLAMAGDLKISGAATLGFAYDQGNFASGIGAAGFAIDGTRAFSHSSVEDESQNNNSGQASCKNTFKRTFAAFTVGYVGYQKRYHPPQLLSSASTTPTMTGISDPVPIKLTCKAVGLPRLSASSVPTKSTTSGRTSANRQRAPLIQKITPSPSRTASYRSYWQ